MLLKDGFFWRGMLICCGSGCECKSIINLKICDLKTFEDAVILEDELILKILENSETLGKRRVITSKAANIKMLSRTSSSAQTAQIQNKYILWCFVQIKLWIKNKWAPFRMRGISHGWIKKRFAKGLHNFVFYIADNQYILQKDWLNTKITFVA